MTVLGIDPGQTGALAWLYPDGTGRWEAMPAVSKVGLQLGTLLALVEGERPDHAGLERVGPMPGQGVASMFNFGRGYGSLEMMLAALRIPYETVPPVTWHRDLCGPHKGESPGQAKARALQVVQQRLPRFDLPKTKAKREAVVDALCVALWVRERVPMQAPLLAVVEG